MPFRNRSLALVSLLSLAACSSAPRNSDTSESEAALTQVCGGPASLACPPGSTCDLSNPLPGGFGECKASGVADPCPGDWDNQLPLGDVVGTFLREDMTGLTDQDLMTITFADASTDPTTTKGAYSASLFKQGVDQGTYEFNMATASIPGLGLFPNDAKEARYVYGLIKSPRDDNGRLQRLCIVWVNSGRSGSDTPMPFAVRRSGF